MSRKALTNRDDFEYWLMDMEDALDRFLSRLPSHIKKQLDFSPSSLDTLEAWILDIYPNTPAMLERDQSQIVDGAARYIGQTFRKAIGGRWDIELNNPEYAFFGVPILILTSAGGKSTTDCPLTLATASADRRTGKYLRTVLENKIKRLAHPG